MANKRPWRARFEHGAGKASIADRSSPRVACRQSLAPNHHSNRPARKIGACQHKNKPPTLKLPVPRWRQFKPCESPAGDKMKSHRPSSKTCWPSSKIADELNRVLANLEGSTLVKRLKAACGRNIALQAAWAIRSASGGPSRVAGTRARS